MANELEEKLAEAKKKMFGNLQPSGGKTVVLVEGDARITCSNPKFVVRKVNA